MSTAAPEHAPQYVAVHERQALADLLLEVGPDAPTLCEGWLTRDLAAHLVVRVSRPDAAAGLVLPPLRAYLERVQAQEGRRPWEQLVDAVRQGPPWWSVQGLPALDRLTNSIEYFVHHEDVRRAQPQWVPRDLDAETTRVLWDLLRRSGSYFYRGAGMGVRARPSDGPEAATTAVLREGVPWVTLHGPVGEIVLSAYGRETAGLTIEGQPDDVEAYRRFRRV